MSQTAVPGPPAASSARRDEARILDRGSRGAFGIQLGGVAAGFALQWLLARGLGAEGYGLFVYSLTWVNLLALVGTLGLDRAALRFVPAYQVSADWSLLRGFLGRSHQLVIAAALVLAAAMAGVAIGRGETLDPGLGAVLLVAAAALPLTALLDLEVNVLRGFERVVVPLATRDVLRPALTGLAFLLVLALGAGATARQAMGLNVASLLVALAFMTRWLRGSLPAALRQSTPARATGTWVRVALPLLFVAGAHLLLKNTDVLMVGALLGPTQAGIYAAAVRLVMPISFGLTAVNTILAPLVARLHAEGRHDELQRVTTRAAQRIFAFTTLAGAAALVAAEPLLALFGPEFVAGAAALRLLAASHLANALAGPVGLLLAMTGHQLEAALLVGGSVVLNVGLNGWLIPRWGLAGAALATTVSVIAWNAVAAVRAKHLLGVNSLIRRQSRPLP